MPLRPVGDADDVLARVRHLLLDPDLVRVQIHQPALDADAARAEEAPLEARVAKEVSAETAD